MTKQKMRILCLLFTFFFMGGVSVYAQVGHVEQGLGSGGKFILMNGNDTTRICYYLRNGDDGDWARFCLDPKQDTEISNATWMKVVSESRKVQYRVEAGKRYRIYWREAEKYWDVELLN